MIPKIKRAKGRRPLPLKVRANVQLSPSFNRLTLGGPALADFTSPGLDHGVRLFFPREGQPALWLPSFKNDAWMPETLLQPASRRPWVRNYTIRDHRPDQQELDIEFALHGDEGPASAWAARARPGDPAGIMDEGYTYLPPDGADRQLLVGDESALPAILSILGTASAGLTGQVFLEVPLAGDIRGDIVCPAGVQVTWLSRDGAATVPGALALQAVKDAPDLGKPSYAWIAGESKLATGVRRHLVNERHIEKRDIAFIGYWRHGRPSPG
ncbi:siderophore-interacting protein [Nonomuraea endophytica]|uniref:NADPH-dependent ferric siderophore reductase n=1 Tax=Nonomuraea endophytica TaxID=714136 RepID=A0A7W8ABP8_9ACTN|nr:siderophore-interacting protein [Nonomuraea endophytica]MBB5083227.1 NADPH-dependent ferric siderophore reductase [Nonomuraea endophytica]